MMGNAQLVKGEKVWRYLKFSRFVCQHSYSRRVENTPGLAHEGTIGASVPAKTPKFASHKSGEGAVIQTQTKIGQGILRLK